MADFYSLSISARMVLNMHSLNNEGGEGNQIQTRMVNIVDRAGELHNVNAISGDMLKHIQAEHFWRLALESGLPLCAGCQEFNANRIGVDGNFSELVNNKDISDAELLDDLIVRCALDDAAGNLVTEGKRSLPRKSIVEFGWVVGLPEKTETDSYFHAKYASDRSASRRAQDASEEGRGANVGQAIFHRPASSGMYALVANVELSRIGFNDITQQYVIGPEERQRRYAILVESILYTLLQFNGAMRGTQNPHVLGTEGIVTVSQGATPAPTISPLNADYREEIQGIINALAPIREGVVNPYPFDDLAGLTEIMTYLIREGSPYSLVYAGAG
jgi:CRISPR-associated protein Cst2